MGKRFVSFRFDRFGITNLSPTAVFVVLVVAECRGRGPVRLRGSGAGRADAEERRRDHRRQAHARRMDGRVQRRQERNVPR